MEIGTIQQAKKYIDKNLYYSDVETKKVITLYIGGIHLFYNNVDYEVIAFEVYEDKKCNKNWGKIKLENIKSEVSTREKWGIYTLSKNLAQSSLPMIIRNHEENDRIYAIETAKDILDEHNIKYEIFE